MAPGITISAGNAPTPLIRSVDQTFLCDHDALQRRHGGGIVELMTPAPTQLILVATGVSGHIAAYCNLCACSLSQAQR